MNKETKRQHYVPRTYLDKFAVKRKKNFNINAIEKNNLDKSKIIFPNINNVCIETDIYTLAGKTRAQRMALETFYSDNVENVYNEVYQTLTDEKVTYITEDLHYKIIMTIITMMYRTSKWIDRHNELFDSVLEKMYALCKQTGQDSFMFENINYSINGKTLKEIQTEFRNKGKEPQVLTQLEIAFKLIDIRKYDGIFVSKLDPGYQLITSDNPVILSNISQDHIMPFDPENMINMPLDSRHILTIMPHSQSTRLHRIVRLTEGNILSQGKMMVNNTCQLTASNKYILGSKSALSHFIDNLDNYRKPISDEQKKKLQEYEDLMKNLMQK